MKRIEKPGTTTFPASCDRVVLDAKIKELKSKGHALIADEVIEHGKKAGEITVFHYLSCAICAEKRRHG
jgi:hypothetical protein